MWDYLIVGAGLTGATLARLLTNRGKKVLVIDKNPYIGGACYDKMFDLLPVCQFGGHTFHTSNQKVWNFANKYSHFTNYVHVAKAKIDKDFYSIPINLLTLNRLYGINSPAEAKEYFKNLPFVGDNNFEEKAISTIGSELYEKFFYWYTKKQWGMEPDLLPASIFSRLPVRFNLDDRYFTDFFQGQPEYGYTHWITNILKNIEVKLETYFQKNLVQADKIIYCGNIDEFYNYRFGRLGYRSIQHEYVIEDEDNFGGVTINHTSNDSLYTRTVTFNYFYPHIKNNKYITIKETAISEGEPLYPIPTLDNKELYKKYKELNNHIIFAGRMGGYEYINMDVAIVKAMNLVEELV
jgi:UDP-galactopyranose mutase